MSSQLLSLVGWYFYRGLYTVFIRAGDPRPAPGSARFVTDRRRIQIGVILVYLLYTIYEADYRIRQSGDFYSQLGVPLSASDKAVQSRFRRLTIQYHPDKVAASEREQVEAIFVQLTLAKDTLIDRTKRFRDYIMTGVRNTAGYYLGTGIVLLITSMLGYMQTGKLWRYLVLALMFVIELFIMTRPAFPAVLTTFVNPLFETTGLREPLLPFQLLILLRQVAVTIFIAISQLEPLLRNPAAPVITDQITVQQVDRVNALAAATEQEMSRLFSFELAQYGADPRSEQTLRSSLKEWLVQNTVRNDAEVRSAIEQALERRRLLARPSGS
ncbi:hypothetical protein AMS68_003491 [Peltaster fructicola]|uniref:J domain-containing protein n=1 Tax=Peltaster fructicola TaxID=286661 RepID=A0A6H0XTB1_9PEZI|nr:hypothetical protein AMS68_003491 [Peltaster fructicola]